MYGPMFIARTRAIYISLWNPIWCDLMRKVCDIGVFIAAAPLLKDIHTQTIYVNTLCVGVIFVDSCTYA